MALLKAGVSGSASASAGSGASANRAQAMSGSQAGMLPGGWHPTVAYMLLLIVAEIVAVGFLSRHLLK